MPRAAAILREKLIDEEGNIVELTIWKVPVTAQYPLGVRYRLALVPTGAGAPAVLYDNHQPKGPHRHVAGREEPYAFADVDQLLEDFLGDVRRVLGDDRWPRR
jgi:hypothetical protein